MKLSLFVLALAALIGMAIAVPVPAQSHKVYRIMPETHEHLAHIASLIDSMDTELDVWKDIYNINHPVDIRVHPSHQSTVEAYLTAKALPFRVMIDSVEQLVSSQMADILAKNKDLKITPESLHDDTWYSNYHTVDDIISWLQTLNKQYSNLTTLVTVGSSYEGRNLTAIKISSGKPSSGTKPGVWIDGGIHAREWISTAVVVYMIGHIVEGYGSDANITRLVDQFDWTFLPVFNADGYAYTWSTANNARMWRKTRSKNAGSICVGTDPNRNWAFHWGEAGTSKDPCSDSYQGKAAFSEIEVKSVADYIKTDGSYKIYVNLHSYGLLFMSPWGYTETIPANFTAQDGGSVVALNAINAAATTLPAGSWQHGTICSTIYPASGSSADWTYGVSNIVFSYGVELRDDGQYGFVLPASYIVPSGNEMLAGFLALADYVSRF